MRTKEAQNLWREYNSRFKLELMIPISRWIGRLVALLSLTVAEASTSTVSLISAGSTDAHYEAGAGLRWGFAKRSPWALRLSLQKFGLSPSSILEAQDGLRYLIGTTYERPRYRILVHFERFKQSAGEITPAYGATHFGLGLVYRFFPLNPYEQRSASGIPAEERSGLARETEQTLLTTHAQTAPELWIQGTLHAAHAGETGSELETATQLEGTDLALQVTYPFSSVIGAVAGASFHEFTAEQSESAFGAAVVSRNFRTLSLDPESARVYSPGLPRNSQTLGLHFWLPGQTRIMARFTRMQMRAPDGIHYLLSLDLKKSLGRSDRWSLKPRFESTFTSLNTYAYFVLDLSYAFRPGKLE